jgi:hypothetical protein
MLEEEGEEKNCQNKQCHVKLPMIKTTDPIAEKQCGL